MGYAYSSLAATSDDGRQLPRTNLFLAAVARWDETSAPVRLRDLSATGARLEGAMLPDLDKPVSLSRGELRCEGRVVWREQGRCGVKFSDPLHLHAWVPSRGEHAQEKVDRMIARVRFEQANGEEAAPPLAMGPAEPLPVRIAEELACTARLLEGLSDMLVADPLVVARHSPHLKDIGLSARVLAHIALILASADPKAATGDIDLADLRRRLQRGSI